MRRRQLIEFHEEPWYPEILRELQREILHLANDYTGFAEALSRPFAKVLRESGAQSVLDLCSGAGGPVVLLARSLEQSGETPPRVLLSDLYPHVEDWRALKSHHSAWLDYVEQPVDVTQLPESVEGELVTIVNALHHFPPEMARTIIDEVTGRGSSIFVAEGFPRSVFRATAYLPSLIRAIPVALLTTRHRKLAKLAATVSLLPMTGGWDWFASALRIHEPAELVHTAREIAPHYHWSYGAEPFPPWGRAVYLAGIAPE